MRNREGDRQRLNRLIKMEKQGYRNKTDREKDTD